MSLPNGTTFYVLTEPAEHGVASSNSFFMTENEEGSQYSFHDSSSRDFLCRCRIGDEIRVDGRNFHFRKSLF